MMNTAKKTSHILCIAILLTISVAAMAVVTVPEGLSPGDQYRLVFVTAELHNASSTSIDDYDIFVTSQANSVASLLSLGTAWNVLGSTPTVDARTNTGTDPASAGVPIYNLNGQLVAAGNADLWDGTLTSAINVDQNGRLWAGAVFTGTGIDGLGLPGRQFGAVGFRVQYGNSGLTSSGWTNSNDWSGTLSNLHFYGISNVLQVPAVPEPLTLMLLGLGAAMMKTIRRRN